MSEMFLYSHRETTKDAPRGKDLLPVELDGRSYEFKYEPRCRVCNAGEQFVEMVNRMLVDGMTYSDIHRLSVAADGRPRKVTYDSIRTHAIYHMPMKAAAVRKILEERAKRTQKNFIEGTQNILDEVVYSEVMMKKAFQRLTQDEVSVTPMEGLAAAKALREFISDEEGALDAAAAVSQLNKIINAVKQVVPVAMWQEIVQLLENEDSGSRPLEQGYIDEDDDDEPYEPTLDRDRDD